ncbi:MAG TPA: AIR synthase-related protein, partial [Alphaproteobacteria bacterium]|nr:AIR synthase-related protein [Alphaproteobacteria bacterium]
LTWETPAPFAPEDPLGEAFLRPTRIYVKSCLGAIRTGGVTALAHITGGGLTENIPRVLAPGLRAALDAAAWPLPPVFAWLAREGRLEDAELARTFNCGIGMAVITAPDAADEVESRLSQAGETVYRIGRVERAPGTSRDTVIAQMEAEWRG